MIPKRVNKKRPRIRIAGAKLAKMPSCQALAYRQFWRLVDGGVRSAFAAHPEYLAPNRSERTIRASIVKRVVGEIFGYVGASRRVADPPE